MHRNAIFFQGLEYGIVLEAGADKGLDQDARIQREYVLNGLVAFEQKTTVAVSPLVGFQLQPNANFGRCLGGEATVVEASLGVIADPMNRART
jgi:hypothetical protein